MTCSGFKTAQNRLNKNKKENNNKDYRTKQIEKGGVSKKYDTFDYYLRIKYGFCLDTGVSNDINKYNIYIKPKSFSYSEYSDKVNAFLFKEYEEFMQHYASYASADQTHSQHSKTNTRERKELRRQKEINYV
jgi:hypothetical protein